MHNGYTNMSAEDVFFSLTSSISSSFCNFSFMLSTADYEKHKE